MSIATEITRLQTAKANLKTSLEAKGAAIASDATIDTYSTVLDDIPVAILQDKEVTVGGGTTVISADNGYTGLHEVVVNSSGSSIVEKDVNFYDFDGNLVYSYTLAEAQALTALPELPDHSNLGLDNTSQYSGWNWTLSEVTSLVEGDTAYIGACYDTDDTYDHVILEVDEYTLTIYCRFEYSQIDWGDSTTTTNNSTSEVVHTYPSAGRYTIKISPIEGSSNTPYLRGKDNCWGCITNFPSLNLSSYSRTWGGNRVLYAFEGSSCPKSFIYGFNGENNLIAITIADKYHLDDYNRFILPLCLYSSIKTFIVPRNRYIYDQYNYEFFRGCYNASILIFPKNTSRMYPLFTSEGHISILGLYKPTRFNFRYMHFKNSVDLCTITTVPQYGFQETSFVNLNLTSLTGSSSDISSNLQLVNVASLGSINQISQNSFYGNINLESISIPQTVTSINNNAFSSCFSLKEVIIPSLVTNIGNYAFSTCISLQTVTCLASTPPTLGANVFDLNYQNKIYVPYSADHSVLAAYQSATNWSNFASIMEELPE